MANPTAPVPMHTTPWGDSKIRRVPAATATSYYVGEMIALDTNGNGVHCDNTSAIRFDGINSGGVRLQINSDDTLATMGADQSKQLMVSRPWRFAMKIAAAASGDEGKRLYARFSDEVSYSQTNSILVGFVDQVLSATQVLVNPIYAPLNPVAVSSNVLAFAGATGVNQITMPDNLADALSIAEGSNSYLTFVTTDSGETITVKKLLTFADAINVAFNATTGTKLGTATSQKLAFFNATPIVQPANTVDYLAGLVNLGLRASGGTAAAAFPGLISSSSPTGGIGYATGAGGAVTQATDRSTGVTINKVCGQITMNNASLAAGAEATFTVTNSAVAATDAVVASLQSGNTTGTPAIVVSAVAAGSFQLTITNLHATTADTTADVINFAVVKGVAA